MVNPDGPDLTHSYALNPSTNVIQATHTLYLASTTEPLLWCAGHTGDT